MANPLQIQNNSQLIEDRVVNLFNTLLASYKRGEIKSKTELQSKLFNALLDFYSKIGKPTFIPRFAWGPPASDDWNSMLQEAYNDVQTLMKESDLMSQALTESFSQIEVQRQSWLSNLVELQSTLQDVETRVFAKPSEQVFYERFNNLQNYDQNMVKDYPADIIKESQVLTLSRTEQDDWNDNLTIAIQNGTGFPGNTHQVRSVGGAYHFYGEDNLHMSLAEIVDGNNDTWFEYELFELDQSILTDTAGFGFNYQENIKWADVNVPSLVLTLVITLPVARTINWLNLNPFIPSDKGVAAGTVKSIVVSDGKGTYTDLTTGDGFAKELIYQFPKVDCKTITVQFEQKIPYETLIGHIYFKELESQNVGYLQKDSGDVAGKRVNGVVPTIEDVQLRFDPVTQKIVQPTMKTGDVLPNQNSIKSDLFQLPINPTGVQVGLEALKGWRYMVGIRELGVSTYQFRATSEYTSNPYTTTSPIAKITLDVDESIPEEFAGSSDIMPWTSYYISVDEGKTWNEIAPTGKTGAVTQYLINSNTPKEARFGDTGYIDSLTDITSVRVRILISRPADITDATYYSPIIKSYKLHVWTGGQS